MKYKLTMIILVVFCALSQLTTVAQQRQSLSYGPGAELEGRLTVQWKYGPPNYGENPKTDSRRKIPIVVLTRPINVRGIPEDAPQSISVQNVRRIQLVLTGPEMDYKALVGKQIRVKGALWHATTGGHYTDVVIFVDSIEPKRRGGAGRSGQ
jgi:hypothetical protein